MGTSDCERVRTWRSWNRNEGFESLLVRKMSPCVRLELRFPRSPSARHLRHPEFWVKLQNHGVATLRRCLPAAVGVWRYDFSIETEAGCAVDVCGEGADLGGLKRFEDFVAGMAVAVVKPA